MKGTGYILITLLSFPLLAQAQSLSLQQCRDKALENNLSIATSSLTTKQMEEKKALARTYYFPNFKVSGGALYNSGSENYHFGVEDLGDLGSVASSLAQANPALGQLLAGFTGFDISGKIGLAYTAGIQLEQPVYMGGKITASNRMAEIGHQMAGKNEVLTREEVLVKVDEAYLLAVKAKEMNEVADKYHELLSELLSEVKSALSHGMAKNNDVLRVQVKLNESELSQRKAQNAYRLAIENLLHVMGENVDGKMDVESSFPDSPALLNLAEDIEQRPEYQILSDQVRLSGEQIRLTRSEFLPNVGLMARYGYLNGIKINNRTLFDNASFTAMLTVSIPVFHFGEGLHKTRAARIQKQMAETALKDKSDMMRLELTQTRSSYEEACLETQLCEKSLAQAEENLRQMASMYRNGMATLTEELEAKAMWQSAYASAVEARFQNCLMRSKYLKASGNLR